MLIMKKVQALVETILWLLVVVLVVCVGLPVAALLSLAGMIFRIFRVEFVSDLARGLVDKITDFIKFVTFRIKTRTDEIEALRAQLQ